MVELLTGPEAKTPVTFYLELTGNAESVRHCVKCNNCHNLISFLYTRPPNADELHQLSRSARKVVETSGVQNPGKVLLFFDAVHAIPKDEVPTDMFWPRLGIQEEDDNQIRIAYSMFESSRIAKNWVHDLNDHFDAVVVPDEFLVEVYKNSGVKTPIFVLPLGVDLTAFLQAPLKKSKKHPFVFASFGTCDCRKNQLLLVRSFYKAFGNNPNVLLKLCWRHASPDYRNAVLAEIAAKNMKNVRIEEGPIDKNTYLHRFSSIDCLVNITLGEGFSIQPREAMALGIPVIVSNNTAQTTICSSGLVEAVPATIEQAAHFPFPGSFGVQYACSVGDVVLSLRRMYKHYEDYLEFGQIAAQLTMPQALDGRPFV